MIRVALIGLSSASGFLFDHQRLHTTSTDPVFVPVLESATGLATLFDEIWFLHDLLCPPTMRRLPFVRFLNHDSELERLFEREIEIFREMNDQQRNADFSIIGTPDTTRISDLGNILSRVGLDLKDVSFDSHSPSVEFGDVTWQASPFSIRSLQLDQAFQRALRSRKKRHRIDLIVNSITAPALAYEPVHADVPVSHEIVIQRVPQDYSYLGPMLPDIDRVRENTYLVDFRKFIATETSIKEPPEVHSLVEKIEKEFARYRNDVLLEKQKGARPFQSVIRTFLSFLADFLPVPGLQEVAELINDVETRRYNWTALLAELESQNK